jgi:hypothetical protein
MPCRLPLAHVLVVLAILLGLGSGSGMLAQEATPEATPTALAWSACADADGWECATLPVPLDYADPTGPTINLALTRLPAADPGRRIGALLFNPGGPGGPGVRTLHQLGTLLFPDETRARFDIVSRGSSTPSASRPSPNIGWLKNDCRAQGISYCRWSQSAMRAKNPRARRLRRLRR